jgi:ferredoxin-thioredoxin reductase catalytic subunit
VMDASELYEKLKKVHEPKGYYFSNDRERVMELLEALLLNKDALRLHGLSLQTGLWRPGQ